MKEGPVGMRPARLVAGWSDATFVIGAAALTSARKGRPSTMQFILGVIFFVIVVGLVDAGLPWPAPKGRSR
jgi:hypothetical protein